MNQPVVGDRLHVVKCNHCKQHVLFAHRAMHALECRQRRNQGKLNRMNLTKNGQQVYAVAATRKRRGRWSAPFIEHVHADSPQHARAQFMAGEKPGSTHIIETGLAIGWFEDKKGLITG